MLLEDCARLADSVENVEPLAPRRDLRQPDNQSNGFEFWRDQMSEILGVITKSAIISRA